MTELKWDESLSVQIELIDKQHQRLIEIINELQFALQEGREQRALDNILEALTDYTIYHFEAEEEHALKNGSQFLEEHKKEHLEFIDKIKEIKSTIERHNTENAISLLGYLNNWLITHIHGSDKELFIAHENPR